MNADPILEFTEALKRRGIVAPNIIADGVLHRCDVEGGKAGRGDGAYVLHLDGLPAGGFINWRDGKAWENWHAKSGRELTPAEKRAHSQRMDAIRKERELEESKRHANAAAKAERIWAKAAPAQGTHPYLKGKGVTPHGLKLYRDELLVVPVFNQDGYLTSLQFIAPDGTKRYLMGGKIAGGHFVLGKPNGRLCLAEGFATAASIHEATGEAVAVTFDCGNIRPAAKALKSVYPSADLVFCADDDHGTEGNPGLTKATEVARAFSGWLVLPDFGTDRPDDAKDFNDLHHGQGLEAVRRCIEAAMKGPPIGELDGELCDADVTDVADVQSRNSAASGDTGGAVDDVTDVMPHGPPTIPEAKDRPCFRVFDDSLKLPDGKKLKPGVWFFAMKAGRRTDEPPAPTQRWICSPLHIEAGASDGQDNNFGRLLRFKNTLGRWREWSMPMELLRGSGEDLRGELLAMGVEIDPSANRLLGPYLFVITPKRRVRCALQVGWSGNSFVLPDAVIGPDAASVIFQSGERGHDEHARAGTLEGWQSEIAARAIGNPILTLALSASFAGPMLERCHGESGGIHFVGDSSTGKTTGIDAACATWGGAKFRRSWRATANGMEGAAALHNDCLLALDEISECDPREIGAIVYALGNGVGKQRANRAGNARSVTRWRCTVLSSGEQTIGTAMAEGGHRAKAGQSVRLLDVPAVRRFGAFDDLHNFGSGTMFADAIKRAAATHYGHAGRAFLEKLSHDRRDFSESLERIKALPGFSTDGAEGQDRRAAGRFALFALAGELATEYGITGWPEGAATEAAAEGFKAWRSLRGRGNDERRQILGRVSAFIERHGDSRFSNADIEADVPIRDRAGWWRADGYGGRLYLFNSDGLREALKGFDFKRALDTLQEVGALPKPDETGERAKPQRIGGRLVRLYQINPDKLVTTHGT